MVEGFNWASKSEYIYESWLDIAEHIQGIGTNSMEEYNNYAPRSLLNPKILSEYCKLKLAP